jgi:hypothetical protein
MRQYCDRITTKQALLYTGTNDCIAHVHKQALLTRKATAAGAACSSQRCSHDHHAHSQQQQQQQQQLHDHDGQRCDEHSHSHDAHKHTSDCSHSSTNAQQAAAVHEQPQTQTEAGVLHETIHSAAHPAAATLSNVDSIHAHTTGSSSADLV